MECKISFFIVSKCGYSVLKDVSKQLCKVLTNNPCVANSNKPFLVLLHHSVSSSRGISYFEVLFSVRLFFVCLLKLQLKQNPKPLCLFVYKLF